MAEHLERRHPITMSNAAMAKGDRRLACVNGALMATGSALMAIIRLLTMFGVSVCHMITLLSAELAVAGTNEISTHPSGK